MKNYPRTDASASEAKYNNAMNSARARIEHAHARLKNRWRRLQCMDFDLNHVARAVHAAAILHNVCQAGEDVWAADDDAELDAMDAQAAERAVVAGDAGAVDDDDDGGGALFGAEPPSAIVKRDNIKQQLAAARRGF